MLFVFDAWDTRTHRIKWNRCDADNLTRVINSKGNGFWAVRRAKVRKVPYAVKEGMKGTLVRSKEVTHDLVLVVDISRLTFRGRMDVCHDTSAIHKCMSHAVDFVGRKTNS